MMATYPAVYRDAHGEEQTDIENDGQTLRMVVRGVDFISTPFGSFDDLKPLTKGEAALSSFIFDQFGSLIAATLHIEMPVLVVNGAEVATETLSVIIDLDGVGSRRVIGNAADPRMTLTFHDKSFVSRGGWGAFEGEMLQIQRQMLPGTYMKCCFNCAYSGYDPGGNGLWGMYCHRNHKEEYLTANDKPLWFRLNAQSAEYVQEIHLCPEFERWDGETGYRDPLQLPVINKQ